MDKKVKSNKENINKEETIFDANRDNNGKGASPDEIIKLIEKIRGKK